MDFNFFLTPLLESLQIALLVLVMMIIVDFINVGVKGRLARYTGTPGWRQYALTNFLGATPGCLGSFTNVSLYIHGLVSFGALAGAFVATAGDEAFVMLAQLGWQAVLIFILLFVLGIAGSFLADYFVRITKIEVCVNCKLQKYHETYEHASGHFFLKHVWEHLIKKHIIRTFLWTFGALLLINILNYFYNLENITEHWVPLLIISAALIGLLPESGPHIIFISLFASGFAPFSVLLTSSIVQDGHGMLPLLSFSLKDSIYIKVFNFFFGLGIGFFVYAIGY